MAHVLVPNEDTRKVYAVGGTPTTDFAIPFTFFDDSDIKLYNNGVPVSSNDYTVNGNPGTDGGFEGGTVVLDTGVTNTTIVVSHDIAIARDTDFPTSAYFDITALNTQLDRLTVMAQKLNDFYKRALKLPLTSGLVDGSGNVISLEFSEDPIDDRSFVFDASTKKFRNATVSFTNLETYGVTITAAIDDITAVADNLSGSDTIGVVASDLSGADTVGIVAGNITNVNIVAGDSAAINTIAANLNGTDTIGTVAALEANINTVATNITDVVNVSNNLDNLTDGKVTATFSTAPGVAFAKGEIGYITSNGIVKANASAENTASGVLVMANEAIAAGTAGVFMLRGEVDGLTGLTADRNYYMDITDGAFALGQPYQSGQVVRVIGTSTDTTKLFFDPSPIYSVITNENEAPPVVVESSSQVAASDGNLVVPVPAGAEVGDYLLLILTSDFPDAATNTFTVPAGWTALTGYTRANAGAAGVAMQVFYKFYDSDGASITVTEDALTDSAAVMLRISGIDGADPVDVSGGVTENASEPYLQDISTSVDATALIGIVAWDQSKTLVTAPGGYTALEHVDTTGIDLHVSHTDQTLAGASGTQNYDISATTRWISHHIAFRKVGATAGGGGTDVGPFDVADLGDGSSVKLTLPVNESGDRSGNTDAYEIFPTTYPGYDPNRPEQLENYVHPTYFLRTASAFTLSSPRYGAYTSSNTNGPARCEMRHSTNYTPTQRMRAKSTFKLKQAPANSKCTCNQIHRQNGSPVVKGSIKVASDGLSWDYRFLVKKTDGGSDVSFDDGLGDKVLAAGLAFNTTVTCEYDFDPVAETLKVWVNTANTNTPTKTFTGVKADGLNSYFKPAGVYPNDVGDGDQDDLFIVELLDFQLIDNTTGLPL